MTVDDALRAFDDRWIAQQGITTGFSYRRTLALLRHWLTRGGRSSEDDLSTLSSADLLAFLRWHAASGLVDDAAGTRKAALHLARTATWIAGAFDRPDLAVDRSALIEAIPLESGTSTADR